LRLERDKLNSVLLGAFLSGSFAVLLLGHLTWIEMVKDIPEWSKLVTSEPSISQSLLLTVPLVFVEFLIASFLIFRSLSSVSALSNLNEEYFYPSILFIISILIGFLVLAIVPLAINGPNIVGLFVFTGLGCWAHNLLMNFKSLRRRIRNKIKRVRHIEVFTKRLELEHQEKGMLIQWIVWSMLIFATTGVAGALFGQISRMYPVYVLGAIIVQTILMAIWAVLGLWFGIIAPTLSFTRFIRETMDNIS
jgi:hypothetical protein